MKKWLFISAIIICIAGCNQKKSTIPVVGFADAFQDNTIEQAKTGFIDALQKNGFDEKNGTVKIIYRNAQGNIPTLTQIIKYFISQKVSLIATNPFTVNDNGSSKHKRHSHFYDGSAHTCFNESK